MDSDPQIVLKTKYVLLTRAMYDALRSKKTSVPFSIDDAIRSGKENPDSSMGVYAGAPVSYDELGQLFEGAIAKYHNFNADEKHVSNMDSNLNLMDLDPTGERVISTRIRVGRNLAGFPFAPIITREQRAEVERKVVEVLNMLEGDLAGEYFSLENMPEDVRARLVADHFLFKKGDQYLESAGANRDWPASRGIFHNPAKTFLVWVNEEDQLRIISMQPGGNVQEVFARLAKAVNMLEQKLGFAQHERYGYLSSCPTNLGTAMRASVHIRIPKVSQRADFKEFCVSLGLSVRGIDGEHSESKGGIYDISNTRRLGLSEADGVRLVYEGVRQLLAEEYGLN